MIESGSITAIGPTTAISFGGNPRRFSPAFLAKTKRQYASDDYKDSLLRQAYAAGPPRGEVARLAKQFGWPAWAVKRRAAELKLSRPRIQRPWSDTEQSILEAFASREPGAIRRRLLRSGFSRSITDIRTELRRREYREKVGLYSLQSLARCFGVSPAIVRRWISRGDLPAVRRGTARTESQGGDAWEVGDDDVREFVAKFPTAFSLAKVDQVWFLDLLLRAIPTSRSAN